MTDKATLRREARMLRQDLQRRLPDAGAGLVQHFITGPLQPWQGSAKPVIAGYWPHGSEIDTKPLLIRLIEDGYEIALPVSEAQGLPLRFRRWSPDTALTPDTMGMPSPPTTAPLLNPDIVIIPALAFDRTGHRLGSGAGYYDITLAALRAGKAVIAITVAYAGQEVPTIFPDPHDQAADWIVSEMNARLI